MKTPYKKNLKGFTLVELLVVIAIIAGLAALSSPVIIRQAARSRATQAITNGKDIYTGIREYSFKQSRGLDPSGTDSNTTFRTLFQLAIISDEKPFYVKGVPGAREASGDIGGVNAANALADSSDNVFAYCSENGTGFNVLTAPANAPILATPVITGGTASITTSAPVTTWTFHLDSYGGQAVFVRSDGSAAAYPLTLITGTLLNTSATDNMFDVQGNGLTIDIEVQSLVLSNS